MEDEAAAKAVAPYRSLAHRIDPRSELPLARQIEQLLVEAIEKGTLQPGDRLPAERLLMRLLGVSRGTLRQALAELIDKGYLSAAHGRGNFVLAPPTRRELRILALESFRTDLVPGPLLHYGWIDTAAKAVQARVHYRYMPEVRELEETLRHPPSGYDALLIFRAVPDWSLALEKLPDERFRQCPLPVLVLGRTLTKPDVNRLSWDYFEAARLATQRLVAAGHQRIGFIGGTPVKGHSFDDFHRGYLAALREAGLKPHQADRFFREGPLGISVDASNAAMSRFLKKRAFSAALVALVAEPFEAACNEAGILLPRDLAALLVGEDHSFSISRLKWAGYAEPSAEVARRGLEIIAEVCRGGLPSGYHEMMTPVFHPGDTL